MTQTSPGLFQFKRKYGTILLFETTSVVNNAVNCPVQTWDTSTNSGVLYLWARVTSITDRYNTVIQYTYPGPDTLIPSTISSRGKTITITSAGGLVSAITDPHGKTWNFYYGTKTLTGGDSGSYGSPYGVPFSNTYILPVLTSVKAPDGATTRYDYYTSITADHWRPLSAPGTPPAGNAQHNWVFRCAVNSITDPNNHTYQFSYYVPYLQHYLYENNSAGAGYYPDLNVTPSVYQVKQPSLSGSSVTTNFYNQTFLCTINQNPSDAGAIGILGWAYTSSVDAVGNFHGYYFGQPVVSPQNEFEDLLSGGADPRNTPINITFNSLAIYQADGAHETFVFDGDLGSPVSLPGNSGVYEAAAFGGHSQEVLSTTDLCGNTSSFVYGDTWDAHSRVPFLPLDYPPIHYPNPTSQTDALGHTKTFTYDPTWRVMSSCTDEAGRKTLNDIDPANGNRLSEKIYDPSGNLVQETDYAYTNATFPGFMTMKTVKDLALAGDPTGSWFQDMVTTYEPDSAGNVKKETVDPTIGGHTGLNLVTCHTYDANNNKLSTRDPNGNLTCFSYDDRNRLTTTTYADGTSKSYVYDVRGNKTVEYDENGNATLFKYDEWNRVTEQARDMNGNGAIDTGDLITKYTYNNVNSKTSVTDPDGNVTQMQYDSYQRLVASINPNWSAHSLSAAQRTTTYAYNTAANCGGSLFDSSNFKPTTMTDPVGTVTQVVYDKLYRKISNAVTYQPAAGGAPALTATTTGIYDNVGNAIATVDPLGNRTETDYDALNRPTVTRYGVTTAGAVNSTYGFTQNYYASTGLKWQTQDERGVLAEMDYDAAGRPVKVIADSATLGLHATTQSVYDADGNVTASINPLLNEWDYTFNNRNRKVTEQDPSVLDTTTMTSSRPTKTWTYDAVGNAITTVDPRGYAYKLAHTGDTTWQTDTTYDVANRVTHVKQPPDAGGTRPETVTEYDLDGNVAQLTDPNGHFTTNEYDALNDLVKTTDALGIEVNYTCDQVKNRLSVSDGLGQTTLFTYDGMKRNTTVTDALGKVATFVYDGVNKTKRIDALSQETDYTYDARNRLATVAYPSRTADNRAYTYGKTGNLEEVAESGYSHAADVSYRYDTLRRVITEKSGGLTHCYAYDLAGNRLGTIYGGTGRAIASTYDALNRLSTMTENGTRVTHYGYDLDGNIVQKIAPNGDTETVTFDPLNRALSQAAATVASVSLYNYAYAYDLLGNDLTVAETYPAGLNNRTVTNTYDVINRLHTEAVTVIATPYMTTYEYDAANNRSSKDVSAGPDAGMTSYAYNAGNQLTDYSNGTITVALTYDFNGNRATRVIGGVTDTYGYDVENRLISLVKNTTGGAGTYAYNYDYRTRRILRNETAAAGVSTQVIFSGGTSVEELDGGATVPTVEYVRGSDYGGGVGGVLYTLRAGVPSYTHENRRGDVVAKTDATGSLTYQAAYEAFGKRTQEQGGTLDRQKANTKDEDPTGLLNEGFRYRDLDTGSFITADPLGFVDGPNRYTYVNQNPWTKFDPEGLLSDTPEQESAKVLVFAMRMSLTSTPYKSPGSPPTYPEYAGVIYKTSNGQYQATTPIGAVIHGGIDKNGQPWVQSASNPWGPQTMAQVPSGSQVVANYHDHPSGNVDASPADKHFANLHAPETMYIGNGRDVNAVTPTGHDLADEGKPTAQEKRLTPEQMNPTNPSPTAKATSAASATQSTQSGSTTPNQPTPAPTTSATQPAPPPPPPPKVNPSPAPLDKTQ
ncbi:MAG: RHS repeat-associated core domain-containing protein [Chthoniobacteraceae bacterium]